MTQTEKYLWLIDTLYKSKGMTLKELSAEWKDHAGLGFEEKLHRATFNRWKNDIETQFGIEIICRSEEGYRYVISNPEVIEHNVVNKWLLDTLSTGTLIQNHISLNHRILVSDIPSGNDHLKVILKAMKGNNLLWLTYQRFGKDFTKKVKLAPYCIKLFENRWYVIGLNDEELIKIYGLDRIQEIELLAETFRLPPDFNAKDFFSVYYGIHVDPKIKPRRIVLRANEMHKHYLKSLPLHESQQLIEDYGDYADFELFVTPTYDFIMKLLQYGSMIEVIKPDSLREEVKGWIEEMNDLYKK